MTMKIGFIGSGAMATAMSNGLNGADLFQQFWFSDPSDRALYAMSEAIPGCKTTQNNEELVKNCDVVVLCVKPNAFEKCMTDAVKNAITSKHLIISIMAGLPLEHLEKVIGSNVSIVRTMPNTPLLVRKGSTAFTCNKKVTKKQGQLVRDIFSNLGFCVEVEEYLLDAVTGVSGSGPAYVCLFIEAMADGGVYAGLPRPVAQQLAINTVLGTATLLQKKNLHPGVAKDMVTSPGGTTIYAVRALEEKQLRAAVIAAVTAAAERSKQLRAKM